MSRFIVYSSKKMSILWHIYVLIKNLTRFIIGISIKEVTNMIKNTIAKCLIGIMIICVAYRKEANK